MAPMPVIENPRIGIPGMPVPAPFDMSGAAVMPGDIAIIECGFAAFPPGAGTFSIIRAMACAAASLIPARPASSSSGVRKLKSCSISTISCLSSRISAAS